MRRLTAVALLLLISCTDQAAAPPEPRETPTPSPTESAQPPPRAVLRLVTNDDPSNAAYVEGMRFAIGEVAERGDLDLQLLDGPSVEGSLTLDPTAMIVVGDPAAVTDARPAIEEARVPVILVGGDLYTSKQLFRYSFQTSVPIRWQARVLASYLIEDRQDARTVLVTPAATNMTDGEAFNAAWLEEGASLDRIVAVETPSFGAIVDDLEGVDSVVFTGGTAAAAALSHELARLEDPPQLALSPEALDVSFVTQPNLGTPGTVACYTYAWSGWADMLPRVHSFRERFAAVMGHYPASLEQEGYDAILALAEALLHTGGEGGDRLVQELETFREETYASVPVRLGPDDHVLAEQSHLGLFAIEEPIDGALPRPEASSLLPWRPILRTFTTDGEKMNFLDRDKRIFFPFWRPKRPTPKYWRSLYGIVSRPSDALH
jgi:ABC-type branched-subunit amino acid transport system substrate-binding protein